MPETDVGRGPSGDAFEVYAPMELANYLTVLYEDPSFVERGRDTVRAAMARAASDAGERVRTDGGSRSD